VYGTYGYGYGISYQDYNSAYGGASNDSSSWDCAFNAFIDLVQRKTGTRLNKTEMVNAYNAYSGKNAQSQGGVQIGTFMDFLKNYCCTAQIAQSWTFNGQLLAFKTNNGTVPYHFVRPTSFDKDSNGQTIIKYYDPTTGKEKEESLDYLIREKNACLYDINQIPGCTY
jgi:hypothetical protein